MSLDFNFSIKKVDKGNQPNSEKTDKDNQSSSEKTDKGNQPNSEKTDQKDASKDNSNRVSLPLQIQFAGDVKSIFQYIIGFSILLIIVAKGYFIIKDIQFDPNFHYPGVHILAVYLSSHTTLFLVGQALAVSAAVELAYMLYTPGPDEAVDPFILGITSSGLIVLSESNAHWEDAAVVLAFTIGLYLLFRLRKELGLNRTDPPIKDENHHNIGTRSVIVALVVLFLLMLSTYLIDCVLQEKFKAWKESKPCIKISAANTINENVLEELLSEEVKLCVAPFKKDS